MHAEPQVEVKIAQIATRRQWQAVAAVAACLVVPLLVFLPTFLEIMQIWNRSQTFTHGWLVLPAFLYVVWQQRAELAAVPIQPFLPATTLAVGTGFVWLLGELASALTPSFFAVVAMVPIAVTAVLGWRWTKMLAFPLAFLFFAVPFGQVFVPTLTEWTADFTVLALQASGVPVYREAQNFVIPSGSWSVVEACSGIRYLIASMVVGALYAWLMYRSAARRWLFFGASILVPIIANWLRAYIIVMLGHLSDNRIATGVDHLIYGWIFFGIVMMILYAVGAIWREDHRPPPAPPSRETAPGAAAWQRDAVRPLGVAAALMAAVMLVWPAAAAVMMQPRAERTLPLAVFSPNAGWSPVQKRLTLWQPALESPSSEQHFTFEKDGRSVGVYFGLYRNQRQGAELVNQMNQLLPTTNRQWHTAATGRRAIRFGGASFDAHTEAMRGPAETVVAWQWYWLGQTATSSDAVAKFDLAFDRLLGRDDTSAWVTVYVVNPRDTDAADRVLAAFVVEMGDALEKALQGVAGR